MKRLHAAICTLILAFALVNPMKAQGKIKLTKSGQKDFTQHGDSVGPAGITAPLQANRSDSLPGGQKGASKGTRGYGKVVLKMGTEFFGNLDVLADGSVRVSDNPFFSSIRMSEVRTIQWLDKVVVKLKSGTQIVGHLIAENATHLEVETVSNPKALVKIALPDIEKKTVVSDLDNLRGRSVKPRVALMGGSLFMLGNLKEFFSAGPVAGLSVQQSITRLVRRDSYWIPDIRLDANALQFQNTGYSYQALYVNAGPAWILNGWSQHRGTVSLGVMPGIAFEKASSPAFPAGESGYTFSLQMAVSYDYPIFKQLHVGLDFRSLYSLDSGSRSLYATGIGLRTSYQF